VETRCLAGVLACEAGQASKRLDLPPDRWWVAAMSKHLAGLMGLLVGLVVLVITGFIMNAMLESIPHSKPKPQPTEVSVGVIAESAQSKGP
jgi:hypothetical protein